MNGWIKLHRKMLESSIFSCKSDYVKVWLWCLLRANHEKINLPFNGSDIELLPGQFITGRVEASKTLNLSEQSYRSAINYLKSTSRLTSKSTNKFSIITVVKWEEYQVSEKVLTSKSTSKLTNQQPASNQPVTTDKKDKNNKNDKKIKKELANYVRNDINPLIELFEKINPTTNYGNTTQRKALEDLIAKFGLERTRGMIEFAISVQGKKYAPTITTPHQLKEKLSQLIIYHKKESTKPLTSKNYDE